MKKFILLILIFLSFSTIAFGAVTQTQVLELYIATFNRSADRAGLDYWVDESGLTIEQIAQSFFDQEETKNLYPVGTSHTIFVTTIYQNVFGRTPDEAGLAYWVGDLEKGVARSVMIQSMKNGAKGDDAILINNKTQVAQNFVNEDLNNPDQAKDILALVTADESTVTQAKEKVANYAQRLVKAELIDDIDSSVMLKYLQENLDPDTLFAFGYKALKITYKTTNQKSDVIEASGLLVIPTLTQQKKELLEFIGQPFSISLLCDNHSTIFTDAQAPTNVEKSDGMPNYQQAVAMTGLAGFASILPDYQGYGVSKTENHPYMLKDISARNSLDMIKASVEYLKNNNIDYNKNLFVSGYSEGGYVAMALAQKIQSNPSDDFILRAVAPMAGPYDLKGLGDIEFNTNHTMIFPAFLAFLTSSYSLAYDDINLDDLTSSIDSTTFHNAFDGTQNEFQIHQILGLDFNQNKADEFFSPIALDDYKNNDQNPLKVRLTQNNIYDWKPEIPMKLIHCKDDEIIPFSMAQTAFDKFIENGTDNSLITLEPIETDILSQQQVPERPLIHVNCAEEAYLKAITWFTLLK